MGRLPALNVTAAERAELSSLASRRKTAQALALRARIVLACAEGGENKAVAEEMGLDRQTVGKWRRRFLDRSMDGLHDDPRPGAPRTVEDARIEAVIVRTLETTPKNATHWSSRSMAEASGLSVSTVQRIWRAFGLQPHRLETFKLSTDPTSWPRCATLSGSTSPRPSTPSCFVWMRNRRSRRSTAPSPCCRCGRASRRG